MSEQHHLGIAFRRQPLNLCQHMVAGATTLRASGIRDDAKRAKAIAPFHDRHERFVRILPALSVGLKQPVRILRNVNDVRGSLFQFLNQLGNERIAARSHNQVDVRCSLEDLRALHLSHAAQEPYFGSWLGPVGFL